MELIIAIMIVSGAGMIALTPLALMILFDEFIEDIKKRRSNTKKRSKGE